MKLTIRDLFWLILLVAVVVFSEVRVRKIMHLYEQKRISFDIQNKKLSDENMELRTKLGYKLSHIFDPPPGEPDTYSE
jgi:hypothetical protein